MLLQSIKLLCKDLDQSDYQLYGAKKALNVLQLKAVGDFVNGSISDEIPIPIVSLAREPRAARLGPLMNQGIAIETAPARRTSRRSSRPGFSDEGGVNTPLPNGTLHRQDLVTTSNT